MSSAVDENELPASTSWQNVDEVNARRFKKMASTVLKVASSGGGGSGSVSPAVFAQICGSMDHLESKAKSPSSSASASGHSSRKSQQQTEPAGDDAGTGTSISLGDFSELRKLTSECVVRNSVNVQISAQNTEEEHSEQSGQDGRSHYHDAHTSTTETGSGSKVRRRIGGQVKKFPAQQQSQVDREQELAQGQGDTTSGQKISVLLQQSEQITTQELEREQAKHEQLVSEVSEMVGSLKESAILMNTLVLDQNLQLDDMTQIASDNMEELGTQRDKMKEQTKTMATSVWTTVGTVLWILFMFSAAYAVMRIFPKP